MEVRVGRNVFSIIKEEVTWLEEGVEQTRTQFTVRQAGKEITYYDASVWKTVGAALDEFMDYMEIEMELMKQGLNPISFCLDELYHCAAQLEYSHNSPRA